MQNLCGVCTKDDSGSVVHICSLDANHCGKHLCRDCGEHFPAMRSRQVTITREEAIAVYRHAEDIRVLVEVLLVSLNRWKAVVADAPFLREKKKGKKKREKRTIAPKRSGASRSQPKIAKQQ